MLFARLASPRSAPSSISGTTGCCAECSAADREAAAKLDVASARTAGKLGGCPRSRSLNRLCLVMARPCMSLASC
jgi:hypothetical protein